MDTFAQSRSGRDRRRRAPYTNHAGEQGEHEFADFSDESPPPPFIETPPDRLKLWQLLALLTSLFAAHYLLVQKTMGEAFEKLRAELAVQQAKEEAMLSTQQRDGQIMLQRVATLENDMDRIQREVMLIKERQAVVRQKLGLRSDE